VRFVVVMRSVARGVHGRLVAATPDVCPDASPERKSPTAASSSSPSAAACATEDTLAPEGWVNIPHLATEIVRRDSCTRSRDYEGITGHFNSTGALVTGCRQEVDAYGAKRP
jgi:hypothetical protein